MQAFLQLILVYIVKLFDNLLNMLISNSGINVPIPVTPDSGTFDPNVNMKNN